MYMTFYDCKLSFFWDKCTGLHFLNYMMSISLVTEEAAVLVFRVAEQTIFDYYSKSEANEETQYLLILTSIWYFHSFFILVDLIDV